MTTIVLGATGGVGSALCRQLAVEKRALLLVGRDEKKLNFLAAELSTEFKANVSVLAADASKIEEFRDKFVAACHELPAVDALLCPIGLSSPNDDGTQSLHDAQIILNANFTAVCVAAEAAVLRMRESGRGTIVAFSSIAVARPRGANIVYTASKRALESYIGSMRHRLADTHLQLSIYRLGYVATQQNEGKSLLLPQASPARVARHVLRHVERQRTRTITYPFFWVPVTIALRLLPWTIYKRLHY